MNSYEEIIQQLTDLHTHFGPYGDKDFSVEYVLSTMKEIGVKRFATMPAPMKNDGYIPDNHKMLEFLKQDEIEVIPILLTSPLMVQEDPHFELVQDIPYKLIKIHPYAHRWHLYPDLLKTILEHAKNIKIPVMIHTGYDESDPINHESIFKTFPEIQFILAHGKPVDSALKMFKNYPNVWIEISFMDKNGIELIYKEGNQNRILFGTDIPITECFTVISPKQYFYKRIEELHKIGGLNLILKCGHKNIKNLLEGSINEP